MNHLDFAKKSIDDIFLELKTAPEGLTLEETRERLEKYGYNEVAAHKIGVFEILLRQVKNAMVYLLVVAAIISLSLKETIDALIIFIILIINITLGFVQEFRSEKILEKLKNYLVPKAKVRHNGKIEIVDRRNLVLGDIVILEPGDIVPADLRIFQANNLLVDESILTGESYPAVKDSAVQAEEIKQIYEAKNLVFGGTTVVGGYGEGVIIATGKNSILGEIISLTTNIKRKSLFERNINKFSKFILKLVLFTLTIIFIINVILKRGAINFEELLLFSIAMAVSVIPEALPLITTLTLSNGALKMAKKNVVVKRLSAIHDLGGVDVLCTDKTGTITQNILNIKDVYASNQNQWFLTALLASHYLDQQRKDNVLEPFDRAIYQAAPNFIQKEIDQYQVVWQLPFDPARRRNTVVVQKNGCSWLISRGAPEEIINLSSNVINDGQIKNFENKNEELKKISEIGLAGQRVLAIAYKEIEKKESYSSDDEKDLIYLGYAAFNDPLKPTTKAAIQQAKKLGLKIKIITGDSREVAEAVAREVGLINRQKRVFTGAELEQMSKEKFLKAVEGGVIFARVNPVQKYKIVEALEDKYSVAFLGEGINDAPALKLTHVAMVVDSGADISKEAADIILLKKDLKVIVDGIAEGRKVFFNVIKYIKYTLISNFGNFYGMAIISLFIPFLPMLAIQILLLNLLTDIPLIAVATDKVSFKEINKPQKYNFHELTFICIFLGLISTLFDIIFFVLFKPLGPPMLRTLWFIASVLTELVIIYSIRTRFFFLRGGLPSWQIMFFGVLATVISVLIPFTKLGSIFHFVQPPVSMIVLIIGLVVVYFIMTEGAKLIYYKGKYNI